MIDAAPTLARLRAHRAEFEGMGVRHLALFGSRARGEAGNASDVDVAVTFDESAHGLAYFARRQRVAERLAAILAAEVDLSDEAMQRPAVRKAYEADRIYAF